MRPAISRGQLLVVRSLFRVAVAALLLAVASPSAHAQRRSFADTVSARALAESLTVIDALDKHTRSHPKDAAAWAHLGNLAALLLDHSRGPRPGLDRNELANHAWDGLHRAVALDSGNASYWAALAKFDAPQGSAGKKRADVAFAKALALSRAQRDTGLLATLLIERGTKAWTDYDRAARNNIAAYSAPSYLFDSPFATAWGTTDASVWRAARGDTVKDLPRLLRSAIEYVTENVKPLSFEAAGEASYLRSGDYFGEAHDIAPSDPRAYRNLVTLYVARGRWNELAALASDRTVRAPADAWGWMALGLAKQRLHATRQTSIAFDSALARMDHGERAWLDRIDRILDPRDSVTYARASAQSRAETARLLWLQADPLWAADDETPRLEFLARLAFAELRWSDAARHVHGADTHTGELYVRYGPADIVAGNFWIYKSGLIFSTNTAWSRYDIPARPDRDPDDQDITERIRRWQPSRWDNIAAARIDSMPTQVVRFREGADSIDVFLATQAPMAALRSVTAANQQAMAHFWLHSRDGETKLRDSVVVAGAGDLQWTRRVPAGPYYYRVESIVPGALVAGRTAAAMMMGTDTTTGFATRGFGMSDVLFASRVVPRGAARRWTDFEVTPVVSDIARGSNVALVWENYDLGGRDGTSAYTVKLTLERKWKMFLNKIRARIINSWAGMMGVEQTSERVVFTYDRTVAHAAAVADYVTLELADTPAGNYEVTVAIIDNVTGRSTSRTVPVVIHE